MKKVEEVAIELGCCRWDQGDDGFGGEWVADPKAVEVLRRDRAEQRENICKLLCDWCSDGIELKWDEDEKQWYHQEHDGSTWDCAGFQYAQLKMSDGSVNRYILTPIDSSFTLDSKWTPLPVIVPNDGTMVPCSQTKP